MVRQACTIAGMMGRELMNVDHMVCLGLGGFLGEGCVGMWATSSLAVPLMVRVCSMEMASL